MQVGGEAEKNDESIGSPPYFQTIAKYPTSDQLIVCDVHTDHIPTGY